MSRVIPFPTGDRESVASFAAWCMGSAHGDWDPRVAEEHQRVLADPAVYRRWRAEWLAFEAARRAPVNPPDPIDFIPF